MRNQIYVAIGIWLSVASMPALAQTTNDSVVVEVCGAKKMNATPITVHRGELWTFVVIGSSPACKNGEPTDQRLVECVRPACARWADGKRLKPVAPDGWERWYLRPFFFLKRVRSAHWYELTGSVGSTGQQSFSIGRGRTVMMEADGALFLFANDASWRYKNNYGSLRVRISRAD